MHTRLLLLLLEDTWGYMLSMTFLVSAAVNQSINQSLNKYIFNVLGGNWDPTDKKFSSVNSYILCLEDSSGKSTDNK